MAHGVGLPDPENGWEVTCDVLSTNTRLSRKGEGMYTGGRLQRVIRCKRNYSLKVGAPCNRNFYRPQTKLRKGNVFTPVCQSFCSRGGGGCLPQCMLGYTPPSPTDAPLGRHPLPSACWDTHPLPSAGWDTHTPCPMHAGIDVATAADGTHPTGMHSC